MALLLNNTIFPPNILFFSSPFLTQTPDYQPATSTALDQELQDLYMSQTACTNTTFIHTPELHGHPHEIFEPDDPKPFYHQYPEWAKWAQQVDGELFYYHVIQFPSFQPIKMEEDKPLYIGYNTKNGRRLKNSPDEKPNSVRPKLNKGSGKIEVYSNGKFIRQMPLRVLVRFSKTAAAAYPRPTEEEDEGLGDDVNGDGTKQQKTSIKWSDDEGGALDLATEVAKMKLTTTSTADSRAKKRLNLYLDTLYDQPSEDAFNFAFQWMHVAKVAGHGDPVLNYGVPNLEKVALEKLIDYYAAALVLGIRPAFHRYRYDLLRKITEHRPTLATLVHTHAHLPIDDVLLTRFITSYFEHREESAYSDIELEEIENYVCTEDKLLHTRFCDIGNAHVKKRKRIERRRGVAKLQKIAEGLGNENGAMGSGDFESVDAGVHGQSTGGLTAGAGEKAGQENGGKGRRCGSTKH